MDVIDDLQRDGLVIVRDSERFAYGHDAVLLSDFVRARAGERYIDIGTGTGILSILAYAKTGAAFVAIDIDKECVRMASKSVELNKLGSHISVHQADAREVTESTFGRFDGAVCNPPYYSASAGTVSLNESRAASLFDSTLSIKEAIECAARTVKFGGRLYICYPAKSIAALIYWLERLGFALKRLCLVSSKAGKQPYLCLAEAKKGGGQGAEISCVTLEDKA